MNKRTIDVLAERNEEWLKMAKSFKVSNDDAWELVQGMYLKLNDYVKDVDRIMYNETEINTFYVYTTISNLFNSGFHVTGGKGGKRRNVVTYNSLLIDTDFSTSTYDIDDFHLMGDCPECFEALEKLITKLKVETSVIQDNEALDNEIYSMRMFDSLFLNIKEDIKGYVSDWYWYDRKLFKLHYPMVFDEVDEHGNAVKPMSMRKIAKETGISLKSVFNSLKAAKLRLREEFQEDYDKYKLSKQN